MLATVGTSARVDRFPRAATERRRLRFGRLRVPDGRIEFLPLVTPNHLSAGAEPFQTGRGEASSFVSRTKLYCFETGFQKVTPAELVDQMLGVIRREFYANRPEKKYWQDRRDLIRAITWPARHLNDLGARLPGSKHRAILETVINTVKRHGNRDRIERFSMYFLHCVQEHMRFHGAAYYTAAKAPEPSAEIVPLA